MVKRLKIVSGLFVLVCSVFAATLPLKAQSPDCSEFPAQILTESVVTSAEYDIWVYMKKETPNAVPYVQVDDSECHELSLPDGDGWEWVTGNGTTSQYIMSGQHAFKFSVNGGSVLVDKVLVTNKSGCVPAGDGSNCVNETLSFVVDGVPDGGRVSAQSIIRANILEDVSTPVVFEFSIDGEVVSTQSEEPYCLATVNGACGTYDFIANGYAAGQHELKVVGTMLEQPPVERLVTINVVDDSTPPPPPPASNEVLSISVSGVSENETVSGNKTIASTVAGTSKTVTVEYKINNTVYSTSTTGPAYCMVAGTGSNCGVWDSNSLVNGSYTLYVTARADGAQSATQTIPFTISNAAPVVTTPPTKQEVVVGQPNQQASGQVTVTVPKPRTTNASTVTYKVNNQPVATTSATTPTATIDTSQLTNGKAKITATIQKNNGEQEVLQSDVNVRNDALTSSSNWFRENGVIAGISFVAAVIALYFIIRVVVNKVRIKQLTKQYNLQGTYNFVQPQEQVVAQSQLSHGLAAFAIMVVGVAIVGQLTRTSAATGLGFVADIDAGNRPDEFSVVMGEGMDNIAIRMNYNYVAPTPPTPPTPPAEPPATPPTPPPSGNTQGNILNELFDGRSQSVADGTRMDASNTFARVDPGPPVVGFFEYDTFQYNQHPDARVYPAFSSSQKVSGSYSGRFSVISNGRNTQGGSFYHQSFNNVPTVYTRFWWRMDSTMAYAAGNPSLLHWRSAYGGAQYADIRLNWNRNLILANHGNQNDQAAGSYQYNPDTWYDVSLTLDSPSGVSRLIVRDTQGNELQNTTYNFQAGGGIGFIEFGILGANLPSYQQLASMWYDDVRMSTSPLSTSSTPSTPPATPPATPPTPPATPPTPPPTPPASGIFTEDFNDGWDAASVNFTNTTDPGPHFWQGTGDLLIRNGRAYPDPDMGVSETAARANMTVGADQYVQAVLHTGATTSNQYAGVMVRAKVDGNPYTWYKFEMQGGNLRILRLINATFSEVGAHTFVPINSFRQYTMRLEIRGNTLIGKIDGQEVARWTNSEITSGTPGLIMYGDQVSFDDFEAGPL